MNVKFKRHSRFGLRMQFVTVVVVIDTKDRIYSRILTERKYFSRAKATTMLQYVAMCLWHFRRCNKVVIIT